MKEKDLLAMDLQFFAEEGDSADVSETGPVEQSEGESAEAEAPETDSVTEEAPAEPQFQSDKANAAFASMRRELEAARKAQAEVDSIYARQFGNYRNPETGKPIRSAKDYSEAMLAQERLQAKQKLQENNIDPSLIDSLVANSPVVRQAQATMAELTNIRAQQEVDRDIIEVLKLDPSLNSKDDMMKDPSFSMVLDKVRSGMSLVDAYKLVNFDRLSSSKTAAARQAVVNQVKGQAHLSNGTGINVNDSLEDIPANMVDKFKDMFPEKSMKELKELYNKTITSRQ